MGCPSPRFPMGHIGPQLPQLHTCWEGWRFLLLPVACKFSDATATHRNTPTPPPSPYPEVLTLWTPDPKIFHSRIHLHDRSTCGMKAPPLRVLIAAAWILCLHSSSDHASPGSCNSLSTAEPKLQDNQLLSTATPANNILTSAQNPGPDAWMCHGHGVRQYPPCQGSHLRSS